ncbi:MAG TPA: OPT/YSL family transporter [Thermoanaerobaculia bacterium]|nr:OPT/YSL family transporter [Thermoanaerobaculia bacterium]
MAISEAPGAAGGELPEAATVRAEPQAAPAFRPFIPAEVVLPELTPLPLVAGTILGVIFGASSLYLVLKVGITVSASIPVAVISITLFRMLAAMGLRRRSILENNIVQTAGSAGESIAFGIGVTMPAILILGFDLEITRVMLVSVLGGLLGVLMMIPLRRAMIVAQHGVLKFPEGTACAEVLKAGASEEERRIAARAAAAAPPALLPREPRAGAGEQALPESGAGTIFTGFGVGLLYKTLNVAFKAWKDIPEKVFKAPFEAGSVAAEISPELLGVGYIIGPRVSSIMCAGGVLAYLVLIPAIKFFGRAAGVVPPGTVPIADMAPDEVRGAYVLYIGAGAVAAGGIISLVRSLPTIWQGLRGGLADLQRQRATAAARARLRTDQDLSLKVVAGGCVALVAMIMFASSLRMNLLGAVLIVVFGFLFVTVSSRLTGEIGSSSNPISGMTVATLLLTCLVFLELHWTGPSYYVTALSVGAIVCIAASNGGTISQDLKTGFLIGSTPRHQQVAMLVGSLASALLLGPILLGLNDNSTVYVPRLTFEPVAAGAAAAAVPAPELARLPLYADSVRPPVAGSYRVLHVAAGAAAEREGLGSGDYLVDGAGRPAYRISRNFPAGLRAGVAGSSLQSLQSLPMEKLRGPQALQDGATYRVWQKTDDAGGAPGRYLVDAAGVAVYLVDPGINGTHPLRPDGTRVPKYDAPKATLMSYIIKGILNRQLPWGLVLLGVMIAIVLEMSGISSLAFAVGVYLPLSSTSPIFVGGIVRWLVDRHLRHKLAHLELSEEQLVAEGDRSPGVLMASGYIAGGAIAGIVIAFMTAVTTGFNDRVTGFMTRRNPLFAGPAADLLALLPFAVLVLLLYLAGREAILDGRRATKKKEEARR